MMKKLTFLLLWLPLTLHAQDTWETLVDQTIKLVERRQYDKAIETAEKARQLVYEQLGPQSGAAFEIHGYLEFLYENRGYLHQAAALYLKDKQFLEASGKTHLPLYGEILSSLALLYEKFGEYREAEIMYQQVLESLEQRDEKNTLQYHQNLRYYANIQFRLGQIDKAEQMYLQVLDWETTRLDSMHLQRSITLNNLAMVHLDRGNRALARRYFREALQIIEQTYTASNEHYADMSGNLAMLLYEDGKPDSAAMLLEQALNTRSKVSGKSHPECGRLLVALGNIARDAGQYKTAQKRYTEAMEILAKNPGERSPAYLNALFHYTLLLEKTSAYETVFPQYQKLLGLIRLQVQEVFPGLSENEKASFYHHFLPQFNAFRSYCLRQTGNHPELAASLYDHLLFSKGLIAEAQRQIISVASLAEQPQLRRTYSDWQAARTIYARAVQMPVGERSENGIDLPTLENQINLLEKQLAALSEEYAKNRSNTITWQEIVKKLKPGEAAVEILRLQQGEDVQYSALILSSENGQPHLIQFPDGEALENRHIRFYQNTVRYKLTDTLSYAAFWQPLEAHLSEVKTIYFSPDGVFNQINPATLLHQTTNSYLADRQLFRLVNSTRWISRQSGQVALEHAVLFGSPQFYATRSQTVSSETSAERKSLLGFSEITALPGTLDEVTQVTEILQSAGASVQSHTDQAASEHQVKSLQSPAILHLATHGFFAPSVLSGAKLRWTRASVSGAYANPMLRSGLLLSGAGSWLSGQEDLTEDGILTAYEVMQLPLKNTDLVVLSACETGLGEIQQGEGVYGLQRAFMLAGAENVVMSLWKVDDQATSKLMTLLYQHLISGQPLSEAFQTAQQQLRQHYPQPYYWGAFVVK